MKNVKVYLFILLLLFISGCMSSGTKPLEPIIWQKVFGGDYYDFAFSVDVSNDGGYIVAGKTLSYGAGGSDAYILKLDANGNKLWEKFYGGSADDIIYSILQLDDGSYIGVGETYSMGEGNADFYVLKLKQDGDADWVKSFGGINADIANSIAKLNDGYILAGYTTSFGAGG
uniref:Lipoprotein n=1 Tax=Dictyoglomus thermophilum TaxID=14 RepID=A0A7C3RMA6_DICTH